MRRPWGRLRWGRPSPPRRASPAQAPLLAGHSYGARRTLECLAQRSLPAAGALLLAYPFAPPKRASQAPLPHPSGALPCGFLSGERDSHAPPGTLEAALADRPNAQLWRIPRADHGWSRARLFEPGGPLRQALESFLAPLGSNA